MLHQTTFIKTSVFLTLFTMFLISCGGGNSSSNGNNNGGIRYRHPHLGWPDHEC